MVYRVDNSRGAVCAYVVFGKFFKNMTELTLNRIFYAPTYTIGKLYVNGVYWCDTIEDKCRDDNKNGKFGNGEVKYCTKQPSQWVDIRLK